MRSTAARPVVCWKQLRMLGLALRFGPDRPQALRFQGELC
jgi:hypothetical protein